MKHTNKHKKQLFTIALHHVEEDSASSSEQRAVGVVTETQQDNPHMAVERKPAETE